MTGQKLLTFGSMLKGIVNEFLADNCPHLAASISYYFLLCLFPILLVAISILGIFMRSEEITSKVQEAVKDFLPIGDKVIDDNLEAVSNNWEAIGILAIIGLIWAGMAVFNALRKSINTAWGIRQPRPFLHERALEFAMMTGLGLLLLASIGISSLHRYGQEASIPLDQWLESSIVSTAISITLIFIALFFIYRVVPNTYVPWRYAFFGALSAAILLEIVKHVFIFYTGQFITASELYNLLAPMILIMVWTYISAIIMLFCAKMTSKYPEIKAALVTQKAQLTVEDSENIEDTKDTNNNQTIQITIPSPSAIFSNIFVATLGNISIFRRMKPKEDRF